MIVLLQWIGGLIGGILTLLTTQEAMRWAARAFGITLMLAILTTVFVAVAAEVEALMVFAVGLAMSELGADSFTASTLAWVYCVTPATMPQAVATVVTFLALIGAFKLQKWILAIKAG